MTATCEQIGNLVLRVETPFLETPGLLLTLDDARRYFGVEASACHAVLEALTEARVLTRTPDGRYRRFFPRQRRRTMAA